MSQDCLILDSNWEPQSFCHWTDAMRLIYKGRAQVIKEDEGGRVLRSTSFTYGMPRVIVVKGRWTKRKRLSVPFSRRNIAIRDNSTCQYCGDVLQTHEYTLEHVIPKSQGGKAVWTNIVLACISCNSSKAGLTPAQAGMYLLSQPMEPKRDDPRFNFKLKVSKLRPEWVDWKHLIHSEKASWSYWNVELDAE
jgi:5-methylcytosine-specific restriction endonuclease McrA